MIKKFTTELEFQSEVLKNDLHITDPSEIENPKPGNGDNTVDSGDADDEGEIKPFKK
ncbi:hypothetical protein [Tenacibaculum sp. M341]|uniref:hypothetical protein n=1 Tax=Tenacibaculum sp. M341 TaxID=2530339 RepID=UPI001404EDFB|nr:hypothetical protein [Tenacibaculum sp. M341]